LGGREYAALLRPSVPHLLTPLTGGLGRHRGQCRQAREDPAVREVWWRKQAEAVKALAVRRATLRDIADATEVPVRRVKQLLAGSATAPGAERPGVPGDH
ncbi:hypothetical protein GTY54_37290, partial [Streptomyces sp. SID625]|nr:hypothetical protein [Streptomyces sp. SID625]